MVYLKPKQLIIKDYGRRFVFRLYIHEASRRLFATADQLLVTAGTRRYSEVQTKKIRILTILTEFSPHFLKHDDEILARGGGPGTLSPAPNFVKIAQGDLSLGVNFFYKKIRNFRGSPHF